MTNTIDSHQHYWELSRFDYGWISPANPTLHQDRLPEHLLPQMQATGIAQAILVHATSTAAEIPWLLSLCDAYTHLIGVVGYVDMTMPAAALEVARYADDKRFRGVRLHLPVSDIHAPALSAALHALAQRNCACDLLLSHTALPQAIELVAAYPDLTFVLNHLAGARLRADGASEFERSIQPLAGMQNAFMKLSGYMTSRADVSSNELPHVLSTYVDAAVHCFGAGRLMFGSDWSVSAQASEYAETVAVLRSAAEHLSMDEQAAIWGASARRAYCLEQ